MMFEKAIEQIKAWANPGANPEQETEEEMRFNFPGGILFMWCIASLFFGMFGFDPTWTSNLPKLFALIILIWLAAKEYEQG
jgi:hypothetical protein